MSSILRMKNAMIPRDTKTKAPTFAADDMRFAGDGGEHALGVIGVERLFEELLAEKYCRVGGDDPVVRKSLRDRGRFFARQPRHILLGRFASVANFRNRARDDVELQIDR